MVEAFDKQFVAHAFGPLINYSVSLHVSAASPACDLIEFTVYRDDVDDAGRYIASPYVANRGAFSLDDDGTLSPPDGSGLGIELDDSTLDNLRLE